MKRILSLGFYLALLSAFMAQPARAQIVNMLCSDNTNANCTTAGAGATSGYTTPTSQAIDCLSNQCDFHTYAATTSTSTIFLDCKIDPKDAVEDWYPCYAGPNGGTAGIQNVGNYQQGGASSYITAARAAFYRVRATITGGTVYCKATRTKRPQ